MDLRAQSIFQSSTAHRLFSARRLCPHRTALVSGPRHSFPISSAVTRDHGRFLGRSDSFANEQARDTDPDLGFGALRGQSGIVDGLRLSRQYRSGNGFVSDLRSLDVSAQAIYAGWIVFRTELPDQNCAASFVACVCFILVVARQEPAVSFYRSHHNLCWMGPTVVRLPGVVREKRSSLRQLLGDLGIHLFVPGDGTAAV